MSAGKALATIVVLLGCLTLGSAPHCTVQAAGVQVADLKDQLEKGLKARRPQDFAFIALVCDKVANHELPVKLVKETFQWARNNAKDENYPYPWFEYALRARAKKLGIQL